MLAQEDISMQGSTQLLVVAGLGIDPPSVIRRIPGTEGSATHQERG